MFVHYCPLTGSMLKCKGTRALEHMLGSQKDLCKNKSKERKLRLGSTVFKEVLEISILTYYYKVFLLVPWVTGFIKNCIKVLLLKQGNSLFSKSPNQQTNLYLSSENCKCEVITKALDN